MWQLESAQLLRYGAVGGRDRLAKLASLHCSSALQTHVAVQRNASGS